MIDFDKLQGRCNPAILEAMRLTVGTLQPRHPLGRVHLDKGMVLFERLMTSQLQQLTTKVQAMMCMEMHLALMCAYESSTHLRQPELVADEELGLYANEQKLELLVDEDSKMSQLETETLASLDAILADLVRKTQGL